jgi:iron(II)-dependent oxidoreductase
MSGTLRVSQLPGRRRTPDPLTDSEGMHGQTDVPAMRDAVTSRAGNPDLKTGIAAELEAARERTFALLAPLSDEDVTRQHSPLMSPLVWDLAHIGMFEELWLLRRVAGDPPVAPAYEELYDAFTNPRSERGELALMSPVEVRSYLAEVRARALAVLERTDLDSADPLLADGFVYGMVVQHEHQHCETMLATLQLRDREYPLPDVERPVGRALAEEVRVEGGPFPLGAEHDPWAYDNERDLHEIDVSPFWIDAAPVTTGAYLEFVEAGGYDDARLWHDAGWSWRREAGLAHPEFWRREGEGSWSRIRFGLVEPLPLDEPVQHVCWYEADAYARWAGKRLPSEAEWEKAASWTPGGKRRYPWGDARPDAGEANLSDSNLFAPAPAGAYPSGASTAGAEQLVGDVWEWTSSDFRGYPGFVAFPYAEYSEVFFGDEYKVLRGPSWATHPVVARATFRNWDLPIRRQIFAGFRCARDA